MSCGRCRLSKVTDFKRVDLAIGNLAPRAIEALVDRRPQREMQIAELDYIANSSATRTAIAENYVGLPL
jgi:hypothetical protein